MRLEARIERLETIAANRPPTDAELAEAERQCRELVREMMKNLTDAGWTEADACAGLIAQGVAENHF